jgi:hypothetical protein
MTIAATNKTGGNSVASPHGAPAASQNAGGTTASAASSTNSGNAATLVTLSDQAKAALAARAPTQKDFATITADARATLDKLYKAANVTGVLAGGKPTIDLSGLDRRTVFAVASNSGGKFTSDEQTIASQELQHRFDALMAPAATAAQLIGDYSTLYKAGLDYLNGMSPEEKATGTWAKQYAALTQGYRAAQAHPGTPPQGIANDPIADSLKRTQSGNSTTANDFNTVAKGTRLALDAQYNAAKQKGTEIVFNPQRRTGQLINLAGLDSRSLSAMSLNQDHLFSPDETRAANKELDARTRTGLLKAFQQSQSSGDPRAFSLGIIQQYQSMSPEERRVSSWSSHLLDVAVTNYKSTTSLMSLLNSAAAG